MHPTTLASLPVTGTVTRPRTVERQVAGMATSDGAGVRLTRVLTQPLQRRLDPYLMLDAFGTDNPDDYIGGFPDHPHRGFETITYMIAGRMRHRDSAGHEGLLSNGGVQWMTAGRGVIHSELPEQEDGRMEGFQLWLNLPQDEKMTPPAYLSIESGQMGLERREGAEIRVLAGRFGEAQGVVPRHVKASIYDIRLDAGASLTVPVDGEETAFVFLIEGDAMVADRPVPVKTAVLLSRGEGVDLTAPADAAARIIFCSGKALREPIAWGGPIVMNTEEELKLAFDELRSGSFIKHG